MINKNKNLRKAKRLESKPTEAVFELDQKITIPDRITPTIG
jgi:hypothetical protein